MKGLIFEIQKGTKIENMVKTAGKVYRDEEDLYTILCKYDAAILSGFSFRDFSPKVETAIAACKNGGKVFCITKFKEKVIIDKNKSKLVGDRVDKESYVQFPCTLEFKNPKDGTKMGRGDARIKMTRSMMQTYSIDGAISFEVVFDRKC